MSALGQKQTFALQQVMSALPLKTTEIADIVGFRSGAKQKCSAPERFKVQTSTCSAIVRASSFGGSGKDRLFLHDQPPLLLAN